MHHSSSAKGWLRLACFLLLFLAFLLFADGFLIQTDTITRMVFREMQTRDDIQLAVVGSSVVRDHFNEELISESLGVSSFSVTVPGSGLQTLTAATKELYKTNHPDWVVLVLEPYNFNTVREDPNAQYKTMPWLTSFKERLKYYASAASADGLWLDRALPFRQFGAESLADIRKAFALRFSPEDFAAKQLSRLTANEGEYRGHGFFRHVPNAKIDTILRQQMIREVDTGYDYPILPGSRELLLAYRDLVVSHGSHFLVAISPNHTAHALAEPDFLRYLDNLLTFCRENEIEVRNFFYAKEALLPSLDETYYDLYHMSGEGADRFSLAFARIIRAWWNGEDTSDLFYNAAWQYRESIHRVVNAWVLPVDGKPNRYRAGCNTGSMVTPEYCFVMRAPNGEETLLQDYGPETEITCEIPKGSQLRVYARLAEAPEQDAAWYDYPADFEAYAADHMHLYAL